MKTLFKKADKKFAEIGLVKLRDDASFVIYERLGRPNYVNQHILIVKVPTGEAFVRIFNPTVYTTEEGRILNDISVRATSYELKLILRKMKEKGWSSK
jgi:hypothetical protein